MAKYEHELAAVDGLGLGAVEMDLVVTLVNGFVRGTVVGVQEKARRSARRECPRTSGGRRRALRRAGVRPGALPDRGVGRPGCRRGAAGGERPVPVVRLRLARLLDGIGVLVERPTRTQSTG
jgi:hypothetical protein